MSNTENLLKELKQNLLNEKMSLIELSNEMVSFGFDDVYDTGDVEEFAETGSIAFISDLKDENDDYIEFLVYIDIVERSKNGKVRIVKVTEIEFL